MPSTWVSIPVAGAIPAAPPAKKLPKDDWPHPAHMDEAGEARPAEHRQQRAVERARPTEAHRSTLTIFLAGAAAGAVSRTSTAPLDRLKVLMQAEAGTTKDTTILNCVRTIREEGGWKAFWRGNSANVVKIAPETAIKFLAYDRIKTSLCEDIAHPTMKERFVSGACAGAISQVLIYPFEIVKTRIVVARKDEVRGLLGTAREILAEGGPRNMYRGLGPSLLGIVPYAGIDLAMFNFFKESWINKHNTPPPVSMLLLFGAVSSTCGAYTAYPLQLLRTKLQADGRARWNGKELVPQAPEYTGLVDCAKKTYQLDGLRGFYRGLIPNTLKVVPAVSMSYVVYETACNYLSSSGL